MKLAHAVLKKLKTDDGLFEMRDHVPIGKSYMVDLESKEVVKGFNIEHRKEWEREVISIVEASIIQENVAIVVGFIPTELLEIHEIV